MIDGEQRSNRRRSRANGCERWRESLLVISKHEPRSQQIEDAFELGVILESSEYAGEMGATGMPTCMAPSASSA